MTTRTNSSVVKVTTLGTTLTSPTNYISFSMVSASNLCGYVGGNYSSTIVAIPTTKTLSSKWAVPLPYDAHLFQMITQIQSGTSSFDYDDLQVPVVQEVYDHQVWCASYSVSMWAKGRLNATCPRTRAYEPILVVPSEVLYSIDTSWTSCSLDLRGLYDPPIALGPAASLDVPSVTTADSSSFLAATPASPLQYTTPSRTLMPFVPTATPSSTLDTGSSSTSSSSVVSPLAASESTGALSESTSESSDSSPSSPDIQSMSLKYTESDNISLSRPPSSTSDSAQVQSSAQQTIAAISDTSTTSTSVGSANTASQGQESTNALSILSDALSTVTSLENASAGSETTMPGSTLGAPASESDIPITSAAQSPQKPTDAAPKSSLSAWPASTSSVILASPPRPTISKSSNTETQTLSTSNARQSVDQTALTPLLGTENTSIRQGKTITKSEQALEGPTESKTRTGQPVITESTVVDPVTRSMASETNTSIQVSIATNRSSIDDSGYSVPIPITASQSSLPAITNETLAAISRSASTIQTTSRSGAGRKKPAAGLISFVVGMLLCIF